METTMQASQAKNETRLPRAVLKRSAELTAKYTPTPDESDPNLVTPPTLPAPPNVVVVATPDEPKPVPTADPRENDPAYWKQRFSVTSGVLRAEREARTAEVREFNRRLQEAQDQLAQAQAATPSTPSDLGKYFTPEQVEEMGEDTARAHVTLIEKEVKSQIGALVAKEIKPLQDQRKADEELAFKARKDTFWDKLAELFPAYAEVDVPESGFHDWLKTLNDDGELRQDVMDRHAQALNAAGVAKLFTAFMKTKQLPVPPVTPRGTGANPSGDAPVQAPAGLTPPTDKEIRTHYTQLALGKVTKDQAKTFEARLKLRTG